MKSKSVLRRALGAAALVVVAFIALTAIVTAAPQSEPAGQAPDVAALAAKAEAQGYALVIVELRLSTGRYVPDRAQGPGERAAQRAAIHSSAEAVLANLEGTGAQAYGRWGTVPYLAIKATPAALARLARDPNVISIQEDKLSDPMLESSTAHIGADDTWAAGFGGQGQTVVILDTGIDANHPFYGGRVIDESCWSNAGGAGSGLTLCPNGNNSQTGAGSADALTGNCLNGTDNICDHGSHVAGIAAGRDPGGAGATGYSGVAPAANIVAYQVFTRFNSATDCSPNAAPCVRTYDSDQISALNAANALANVASANMSLGGGMNAGTCDGDARKAPIENLLPDTATVISSGNNGWTDALGAPGCISTAVTVGGVTDPADGVIFNMNAVVDLLAPGSGIDASVPDDAYGSKGGTSMAAPHVTGAFAVLRAIDPSMSANDILNLLETTGVLVTDTRASNPAGAFVGHITPRIQLDVAVAQITEADLRISKDCKPDDPMLAGTTGICTIRVENLGPDGAVGVEVTDEYVGNGTFNFGAVTTSVGTCVATANPQVNSGTVTCAIGGLPVGGIVEIKIPVTATAAQNINDEATARALTVDPNQANNVATDELNVEGVADLSLTKTAAPDPVLAGNELTYNLSVHNNGPSAAQNVVISDVLPAQVSIVSVGASAGTCNAGIPGNAAVPTTCAFDTMTSGSTETMTVVVKVDPSFLGVLGNNASVASETFDPDNSNDLDTTATTVNASSDLSLTKTDYPDPVLAGATLIYEVVVTNNGPSTAVDVSLTDTLPAQVAFQGYQVSNGTGTCSLLPSPPNTLSCDLNDLLPSQFVKVVFTVKVDSAVPHGTTITNTASVAAVTPDANAANNSASADTLVNAQADSSIAKDASLNLSNPSPRVSYKLTAVNNGPSDALNVVVRDELPLDGKKVVYVFDTGNGACAYVAATHDVNCNVGTLKAGATWTVEIIVDIRGSVRVISNYAFVESTTADPNSANNKARKDVRIKGGPGTG